MTAWPWRGSFDGRRCSRARPSASRRVSSSRALELPLDVRSSSSSSSSSPLRASPYSPPSPLTCAAPAPSCASPAAISSTSSRPSGHPRRRAAILLFGRASCQIAPPREDRTAGLPPPRVAGRPGAPDWRRRQRQEPSPFAPPSPPRAPWSISPDDRFVNRSAPRRASDAGRLPRSASAAARRLYKRTPPATR